MKSILTTPDNIFTNIASAPLTITSHVSQNWDLQLNWFGCRRTGFSSNRLLNTLLLWMLFLYQCTDTVSLPYKIYGTIVKSLANHCHCQYWHQILRHTWRRFIGTTHHLYLVSQTQILLKCQQHKWRHFSLFLFKVAIWMLHYQGHG